MTASMRPGEYPELLKSTSVPESGTVFTPFHLAPRKATALQCVFPLL